jgi:phage terminase large subunit GpA-like protein
MDRARAFGVVLGALAAGLAPPPDIAPSAWAAQTLVVPDGPRAGETWDPSLTPYLPEILDHLAPASATNRVVVRKSAQTGFTQIGQAWLGYIVDVAPTRTMMVLPTVPAAQDFNREKLQPSIDETPTLRRKVRRQVSRSSGGSTALSKRFPGGSIVITGANSAADLRSKTIQYALCDEVDEWPADLDGQGDPLEMVTARQMSYLASGDWKRIEGSTPTIKGGSRVDAAFEAGDQRYWHCPCPHCGEYQRLEFGGEDSAWGLKFERSWPHQAHYVCRHCGGVIEEHHRRPMIQTGRWVAEADEPGRHPSYHIDALHSLLVRWDDIAVAFLAAKDHPAKLKTFTNLWLGQAWEARGDAPEWERLLARTVDYPAGTVPHGALVLTMAVDVQQDGLYVEVVGWGRERRSWVVEARFLPGETREPGGSAWHALDTLAERHWPTAWGTTMAADAIGVDSGYATTAVYAWVRRHPKAYALKGVPGWSRPPMGTPAAQDVTWGGKTKRRGLKVWSVGTWGLSAEIYGYLHKAGVREGAEDDPPGYCHFGAFLDAGYFQQLTAEALTTRTVKGVARREWVAIREANHYHDCRRYNLALAYRLGLATLTEDDWAQVEAERGAPAAGRADDLAQRAMAPVRTVEPQDARRASEQTRPAPASRPAEGGQGGGWLPRRDDWMGRRR